MRKLVATLMGVLLAGSAYSQVIEWNYNGQATALGTGCSTGDTAFVSAGNEVSVIFSTLGIELTGQGGAKTARKNCRVVIPTRVAAGYYLGSLKQKMTYGYNRTEGTSGKVHFRADFYDQDAGSLERAVPTPGLNSRSVPFAEAVHTSYWRVMPGWCQDRTYEGNYKAQLTVQGQRSTTSQEIIVQIDGQDIRFDAVGNPLLCR